MVTLTDADVELNCELALVGLSAGYRLELCSREFRVKVLSEGGSWDQAWLSREAEPGEVVKRVRAMAESCARFDDGLTAAQGRALQLVTMVEPSFGLVRR